MSTTGDNDFFLLYSLTVNTLSSSGPVGDAGLVSPEAEVLTGPYLVHLMNGLLSLVKYGFDSWYGM